MRKFYCLILLLVTTFSLRTDAVGQLLPDGSKQHLNETISSAAGKVAQGGTDFHDCAFARAGWIISLILFLCILILIRDQRQLTFVKNEEIASKGEEIQVIQEQINQTNEELMAINSNLECIVEERTVKLSKVNRELDMFLYRSSHDLRRPVTTLMGLVEVSKLGFDETTARYLFSKINDTAVHMDTMLEKFFMINTINHDSAGTGEVNFEEILDGVRHSTLVHNYAGQIHFNVVIEPEIRFISDPQLITFILKNLIDNAIIFRSRDSNRQPLVRVEVRAVGNAVAISVHDNGIGISQENLSDIFTLFYRGSEASKGNGLGLYVVRKAIEKLNGDITVTSRLNEFTCFHITLPATAGIQLQPMTEARSVRVA